MAMRIKIRGGKIILSDKILNGGCIVISDDKIESVSENDIEIEGAVVTDVQGKYISPGFVDIHCHGGGGESFMDCTLDAYEAVLDTHSNHGTTTMYPTMVADDYDILRKTIEVFDIAKDKFRNIMRLPGIHIEGPYIAMEQRGALDPRHIRNPDPSEYIELIKSTSSIKRWTVAPELPGASEMSRHLIKNGIMPTFGHTDCTYEEAVKAYNEGYRLVTHLYSGMPQGIRRKDAYRIGGMVEAAYLIDDIKVELIADGCHLPAELLKLAYKIKGDDSIALVTDAMRGAGMPEGMSVIGNKEHGIKVIIEDGVAKLADRSAFAGSVATSNKLVRIMMNLAEAPLLNAVKMITATPAEIMGIGNKVGKLEEGMYADIIVFDDKINITDVMVNGEWQN
jgi:N-acetylglucosamine-6-phosphate deacetylase